MKLPPHLGDPPALITSGDCAHRVSLRAPRTRIHGPLASKQTTQPTPYNLDSEHRYPALTVSQYHHRGWGAVGRSPKGSLIRGKTGRGSRRRPDLLKRLAETHGWHGVTKVVFAQAERSEVRANRDTLSGSKATTGFSATAGHIRRIAKRPATPESGGLRPFHPSQKPRILPRHYLGSLACRSITNGREISWIVK
ncbi:hypothetical protein N9A94_01175 [Akkermansiaceae bacterium]|nr:hypothetical protein [Akkermansiaceae bacterium]MDB4537068.1 hypothetical protein [Akkermansiaceae bacterium]